MLVLYARRKLMQDPRTRRKWRPLFGQYADMSEYELRDHVMLHTTWARYMRLEFAEVEHIFLNIMAAYLKRKIVLLPFFQKDSYFRDGDVPIPTDSSTKTFQPQYKDTYYIFGERCALLSLYVSAVNLNQ